MEEFSNSQEMENKREAIKQKLHQYYDDRIVWKDLTKFIREGVNVPVYVLEYLLGAVLGFLIADEIGKNMRWQ